MAIVTLTSDLGDRDYYAAALKGALLSNNPLLTVTDITHSVKPFDIKEAAYIIRNAFRYFPKGTIHVLHINTRTDVSKLLVAAVEGHYFITFDCGVLSLAFEQKLPDMYQVNEELLEGSSLLIDEAIAKVADLLSKEYLLTDFAQLTTTALSYRTLQPVSSQGSIRGAVVHIDHYGNAVANITKSMFEEFIGNRRFTIFCNAVSTKQISLTYNEVEEGEIVCLFNSAGYLEVALNKAKASQLMGLKPESTVIIVAD